MSRPEYSFQRGTSAFRSGLIALGVLAIFTWFAFTKNMPFTQGYRIQAVVEDANLLQSRSPVRIAGIDVGEVKDVERYKRTKYALVTMEIEESGRPIREDATLKIRPRLFLEGNFFVDLKPGTGRGDELADGGVIPVGQTATPVQLDQVLTALQSDTRDSLRKVLKGYGDTLHSKPTPAENAEQDPEVHGLTGGQALNRTFRYSPYALRDGSVVADALRGQNRHDLSRTIRGLASAMEGLGRDEGQLGALVRDFNTTTAALASEAPALEETVRLLGPTATNARKGFASIREGLPETRAFARDILPGVRETPATIAAADPWLAQAFPLLGPAEFGGLLDDIRPGTAHLAALARANRRWVPAIHRFNRCATEVMLPTGNVKVDDGPLSSGVENYKEFWYAMVGQAGEGQGFDGNGPQLRVNAASGDRTIATGPSNYTALPSFANVVAPPLRTRPAFPNKVPPLRRDVPCHTQRVPDVNGPSSIGPPDGSRPGAKAPAIPREEAAVGGPAQRALAGPSLVPLRRIGGAGR